jgi:hypothetical protein
MPTCETACSTCIARQQCIGRPILVCGARHALDTVFGPFIVLGPKHSLTKSGGFIELFLSLKGFNKIEFGIDQRKLLSTDAQILILQMFAAGILVVHVHDGDIYCLPKTTSGGNKYYNWDDAWILVPKKS